MPPPCCIVSAACFRCSKIPPMSSGMSPMTKQLNSVTRRPEPAPERMRPAGRNLKSCIAAKNRSSQIAGSASAPANSLATRRQVSSMVLSSDSPSSVFKRYFMSQICCETGATWTMGTSIELRAGVRSTGFQRTTLYDQAHSASTQMFSLCSSWPMLAPVASASVVAAGGDVRGALRPVARCRIGLVRLGAEALGRPLDAPLQLVHELAPRHSPGRRRQDAQRDQARKLHKPAPAPEHARVESDGHDGSFRARVDGGDTGVVGSALPRPGTSPLREDDHLPA